MSETHLITKRVHLTASSSTTAGAYNKTTRGGSFDLNLPSPLLMPSNAINPSLTVESATIWWTTPNIETNVNDQLIITEPDTTVHTITIPQGLYDISDINSVIHDQLTAGGVSNTPTTFFSLSGNSNTQRTDITLGYTGTIVDFSSVRSIGPLLGFGTSTFTSTSDSQLFTSNDTASISPLDFYLIATSLVDEGIIYGNRRNKLIARVPIDVVAGHQIVYSPPRAISLSCANLAGTWTRKCSFYLYDNNMQAVNTGGEDWSVSITITWQQRING